MVRGTGQGPEAEESLPPGQSHGLRPLTVVLGGLHAEDKGSGLTQASMQRVISSILLPPSQTLVAAPGPSIPTCPGAKIFQVLSMAVGGGGAGKKCSYPTLEASFWECLDLGVLLCDLRQVGNFSEPQFSHLSKGNNHLYLKGLLCE